MQAIVVAYLIDIVSLVVPFSLILTSMLKSRREKWLQSSCRNYSEMLRKNRRRLEASAAEEAKILKEQAAVLARKEEAMAEAALIRDNAELSALEKFQAQCKQLEEAEQQEIAGIEAQIARLVSDRREIMNSSAHDPAALDDRLEHIAICLKNLHREKANCLARAQDPGRSETSIADACWQGALLLCFC